MLWVNVFDARLNGFCRYIILRLFHNIFLLVFAQFGCAVMHSISALCDSLQEEKNTFNETESIGSNETGETVVSFVNTHQKLIPFHINTIWLACALYISSHSLLLVLFTSLTQLVFPKIAIRFRHLASRIVCSAMYYDITCHHSISLNKNKSIWMDSLRTRRSFNSNMNMVS